MVNELLINLVNSVLGSGKRTARGNQAYVCPFHTSNPPGKKNFEINFTENKEGHNKWACWGCGKKGKTLYSLFKQMEVSPEIISQLKPLVKSGSFIEDIPVKVTEVKLPDEYKPISNSKDIVARHAAAYLKSRGITQDDIEKYNIGYCDGGPYNKMIIIPSYDENGKLNFFTGRSFEKEPFIKYKNPDTSRDIVPFGLFINWSLPLILCEGPFDAIAIKRNAIPLLGKNLQNNLMKKIVSSTVQKIYIALDSDAMKQAIKFAEELMNEGKEIYLVELKDKDPSSMGFVNFTKLIQKSFPLTQYELMEKKLSLL
jgi:DNA primase